MTFSKLFQHFTLLLFASFFHTSFQGSSVQNGPSCDTPYKVKMLVAVNTKRHLHQAPSVGINIETTMGEYTQNLSEYYAGQRADRPEPDTPYGEVLLSYDPSYETATSVIYNELYNETIVSEYSQWYGKELPSRELRRKFARFTQLVWWCHGDVAFGCADKAPNERMLVVTFEPQGNLLGKYAKNVKRPWAGRVLGEDDDVNFLLSSVTSEGLGRRHPTPCD